LPKAPERTTRTITITEVPWWERLMAWWNSLSWWQKALISTGVVVSIGGTAALAITRRKRK